MNQDELGLPVAKGGGTSVETAANRVAAWLKDDQRSSDHLKVHGVSVEQIYIYIYKIKVRSFFGGRDGTFGYIVLSYAVAHGKRVLNSRYRYLSL